MTSLPLVFDAPRRGLPPRHLADLSADERCAAVATLGERPFRARQLSHHYFARLTADPADMTDIPATSRDRLVGELLPPLLTTVRDIACDEGTTRKTLWRAHDGTLLESVLMRYPDRATVCVSSQAGCGMACPFCATGQGGLQRNLSTAEIVEQVRSAAAAMRDEALPGGPGRLSNVVFMGMGEPLANYPAVMDSVRGLSDPELLGISPRRIVVSTSGLIPRIEQLAEEKVPVTLAISLHAARDELRDVLVPINRKYPVQDLVEAAQGYARKTGRRVSYEWVMLAGVNDTVRDAKELGALLKGKLAHVNLIPFNPVEDTPYHAPDRASIRRFKDQVASEGLNVTVRDTRGREADAACGQLHERITRERLVTA